MGFISRHTQSSEAELARLADGSLPAARRSELRARVAASPELVRALADQEQGVSMLRSVDEPAPAALRTRIEAMTATSPARSRPPRRTVMVAATGLAILAAAVIGVTQVGSTLPSVSETAKLALASPTTSAPAEVATHPGMLAVAVDRVSFPYWRASFGWRAIGTRTEVLRSRRIVTVYYANRTGARVGYSIVAGPALSAPEGKVLIRHGVRFSLVHNAGLHIITWLRSAHTCVLAGPGLSEQVLLRLAAGDARHQASA